MNATKETVMRALSLMLVLGMFVGVAAAQPAPAPAPGSVDPAAAPAPAPSPPAAAAEPANAAELRKKCSDAMNANESFSRSIIQTAIRKETVYVQALCESADTIKAHQEAAAHVEKNQRHVFASYAAIWVIAALFLLYLFQRQQRLKAEIVQLRRDLDAAAKDGKDGK